MSRTFAPSRRAVRFVGRSTAASVVFLAYAAVLWVGFQLSAAGAQCFAHATCQDGLAAVADVGIVATPVALLAGTWVVASRMDVRQHRTWPVWLVGATALSMCFFGWVVVKAYAFQTPSLMIFGT